MKLADDRGALQVSSSWPPVPAKFSEPVLMDKSPETGELLYLRELLRETISRYHYNRIHMKYRYTAWCRRSQSTLAGQASLSGSDWLKQGENSPESGDCIDTVCRLQRVLPGLQLAFFGASLPAPYRQEGLPFFGHVAAGILYQVANCKPLYVLLDPAFDLPEPVVLSSEKPVQRILSNRGCWTFRLMEPWIQACLSGTQNGRWDGACYRYFLKNFINPMEHIRPIFVPADLRPSLVIRGPLGTKKGCLKLCLKKARMVWSFEGVQSVRQFEHIKNYGLPRELNSFKSIPGLDIDQIRQEIYSVIDYFLEFGYGPFNGNSPDIGRGGKQKVFLL